MRILLCNYRYFLSGGPERYLFTVQNVFSERGHTVIPFSFAYSRNEPCEYERYFASPPIDSDHPYLEDLNIPLSKKISLFAKLIYNFDAKKRLKEMIRRERVDIVHSLQSVNFFYPSIIDACKEMKIPIVFMVWDYQLLCLNYGFFTQGRTCEQCGKSYLYAVKNRCLKDSYSVSFAKAVAAYIHRGLKINNKINAFMTYSDFVKGKMVEYGFDAGKIHTVPPLSRFASSAPSYDNNGYILYVGMINQEKGLQILLEAVKKIDAAIMLKIAGIATNEKGRRIVGLLKKEKNIEIVGFTSGKELEELYRGARFVVFPSLWYEAGAHVIIEAMSFGKPVIGTNIGTTPEIIEDGVDGLLFEPGNSSDLAEKINYLFQRPDLTWALGMNAREKVETQFNADIHYRRLMDIYTSVLSRNRSVA